MNNQQFGDSSKKFSIVLFVEEDVLSNIEYDVTKLGQQRNVMLVVQPCPFEAIEFLFRVNFDFPNGHTSLETDFFWHALEFPASLPSPALEKISQQHYAYLVAIVQNDSQAVAETRRVLQSLLQSNA
jgi:hypothetical protein